MTPPLPPTPDLSAGPSAPLRLAVQTLLSGGLVAYPSETVWGLAAHPGHPDALRRLYEVKGRDLAKAVQVSCADAAQALALAERSPELTRLSAFWPGPLTLVVPAAPGCPPALAPGGRVGLRVPSHPVAQALLEVVGTPLLTTSCNLSGQPPATTEQEARALGLADFVLPDGEGAPVLGQASTVLALPGREVLREGSVPVAALLVALAQGGGGGT